MAKKPEQEYYNGPTNTKPKEEYNKEGHKKPPVSPHPPKLHRCIFTTLDVILGK